MDKITIMFEASDNSLSSPTEIFLKEYLECQNIPLFDVAIANLKEFNTGEELRINQIAPVKKRFCILRSSEISYERHKDLKRELKYFGYRLVFKRYTYSSPPDSRYDFRNHQPETTMVYHRYLSKGYNEPRWFPATIPGRNILPAIAKSKDNKIIRKEDGTPLLFVKPINSNDVDDVIAELSGEQLDTYTGTFKHAPIWFEQYIPITQVEGIPVEWRAFFYLDRLIYLCPKSQEISSDMLSKIPKPPKQILKPSIGDDFESIDYALSTNGIWWILLSKDVQFTPLPDPDDAANFLLALADEIKKGYDIPDWTWCVTATIINSHPLGQSKIIVPGSRHFPPGEKVYMIDAYFGQGAERCTVLGKPKYSDKYVCTVIKSTLLENYAVEKVKDPVLLNIMYTGRMYEDFEEDRKTIPGFRWGNTDQDYRRALGFVESTKR